MTVHQMRLANVWFALRINRRDIIEKYLGECPNIFDHVFVYMWTGMMYTVAHLSVIEESEIALTLIAQYAPHLFDQGDVEGQTPLELAEELEKPEIAEHISKLMLGTKSASKN